MSDHQPNNPFFIRPKKRPSEMTEDERKAFSKEIWEALFAAKQARNAQLTEEKESDEQ